MPELGWRPQPGYNVNLGRDNDFVQTLTRTDGQPWPAGTVVRLLLGDTVTWPATVSGASLVWNVDKATVNTVLDTLTTRPKARIVYTDAAGLDLTLTTGMVRTYA